MSIVTSSLTSTKQEVEAYVPSEEGEDDLKTLRDGITTVALLAIIIPIVAVILALVIVIYCCCLKEDKTTSALSVVDVRTGEKLLTIN